MQTLELTSMPISEAGERIRAREVSPVELTEAYLRRIERLNPHVNAYVLVLPSGPSRMHGGRGGIAAGGLRPPMASPSR
jgi:Asp-tRNA(Asn)/Glu-tRNA(Gln) amidotransferase A subunit family amidase